ncbi:hypothetical protein, partial [Arenibacter latericius]|uniref:hypothetical protein n=1 Tax=Arenibacter latericius TaxID=86104 RepID=UPI0005545711
MKNLTGILALSLFNLAIISAQEKTITAATSIDQTTIKIQLQNTDDALATDRDILVKDRRKKKSTTTFNQDIDQTIFNADNAVATDRDILV